MPRGTMIVLLVATALLLGTVNVEALEPDGADANVNCYSGLGCGLDEVIGALPMRDCCLGQGFSFSTFSEVCTTCVVFGWNQLDISERTLSEQGPGYTFQVSYIKPGSPGDATTQEFTVTTEDGTAKEGTSNDYSLSTNTISLTPSSPALVTVIFRVDSVALEERENFKLMLTSNSLTPQDGVFCISELELFIDDVDVVEIQLTEDDYRANEEALSVSVSVTKTAPIARDLVLTVSPVTLAEARQLNSFPEGVETPDNNNGRSPVDADLNDFNNTILTFNFTADETGDRNDEQSLRIPIADDLINEATEQDFVAILRVSDPSITSGFRISRNSSLCRIIDNDPIRIGFEMETYTFIEPQFEEFYEVFLAKENNVQSEQSFLLSLQLINGVPPNSGFSIATRDLDYTGIADMSTVLFPPNTQRLPISFDLLPDRIPESTEAFQLTSASNDVPNFNNPNVLFQQTFIVIEDDDVIVRIGFENTTYTVDEGIGSLEVCVSVFVPPSDVELPVEQSIVVAVETVPGTADETDYTEIQSNRLDVLLFYDDTTRRECFTVDITNDVLVEGEEQFSMILLDEPGRAQPIDTEYLPNTTVVTIIDADSAVIGFFETNYTAIESDGFVTLMFGLISGGVQKQVDIQLTINSGSAQAGSDYVATGGVFTFDPTTTVASYNVSLVDDDIYEFSENLFAQLSFVTAAERVSIDPENAQVEIEDEDVVVFGFSPDSYSVLESAGSVDLGVLFVSGSFGAASISVQLPFMTSSGTAQGSPSSEADFVSVQQMLQFSVIGEELVPVSIVDDSFTEFNETFVASLGDPIVLVGGTERLLTEQEAARVVIQPPTASVEILDNDETVIGFLELQYNAAENAGPITFNIGVISGELRIDVPFSFSTSDITSSLNRAEAGIDYVAVTNQEIVFNSTFTMTSVPVQIIDDELFELVERFNGLLSSSALPPNVMLSPSLATASILEESVIVIGWDQTLYSTSEGDPTVQLCASVTSQAELQVPPFMLDVQYFDITANEDSDYGLTVMSISIGPFSQSSRSACVDVNIIDDGRAENDESFLAMILPTNRSPPDLVISPANTTVNIEDNDVIMIGWEELMYDTNEDNDMVQLCAVITSPSSSDIDRDPFTLSVSCTPDSAAVGEDYQPCPSTIGPFDLSQSLPRACVMVDINDDLIPEEGEEFIAVLDTPTDPLVSIVPGQDITNVTIFDNDVIQITLDPSPTVTVTETDGSLTMCVQISSPPNTTEIQKEQFYVSLSTMDGTATHPSDYMSVAIDNFGPFSNAVRRQCTEISIVLDSNPENNENFKVTILENTDGVSIVDSGGMTTVTIVDSIRRVNDTVVGDPLMTVPIYLPNTTVIPSLGDDDILNLCYEVHGEADAYFNLVSDGCVSVNAHYTQVRPTESQNIIDAVYVRAVDNEGACINVAVNLDGCSASVNDAMLDDSRYTKMGVSVRRYTNRVRIAVPNCQELDLVMWVICERNTFWSSQLDANGVEVTFEADMIKFVIARGFNLQETSHGIIGQFWNIPITVSPITIPGSSQEHYTVTVEYPGGSERSFTGMLWPLTWEYREEYCLYTGNGQAGPLDELDAGGGPNDPVIEGEYFQYKVEDSFETTFDFAHFDEARCLL